MVVCPLLMMQDFEISNQIEELFIPIEMIVRYVKLMHWLYHMFNITSLY